MGSGVGPESARMISGLSTGISSSIGSVRRELGQPNSRVLAQKQPRAGSPPYSPARAYSMAMLRFLFRRLVAQRLLALGVVLTLAFSAWA